MFVNKFQRSVAQQSAYANNMVLCISSQGGSHVNSFYHKKINKQK